MENLKKCSCCKELKNKLLFGKNLYTKDRLNSHCNKCAAEKTTSNS